MNTDHRIDNEPGRALAALRSSSLVGVSILIEVSGPNGRAAQEHSAQFLIPAKSVERARDALSLALPSFSTLQEDDEGLLGLLFEEAAEAEFMSGDPTLEGDPGAANPSMRMLLGEALLRVTHRFLMDARDEGEPRPIGLAVCYSGRWEDRLELSDAGFSPALGVQRIAKGLAGSIERRLRLSAAPRIEQTVRSMDDGSECGFAPVDAMDRWSAMAQQRELDEALGAAQRSTGPKRA